MIRASICTIGDEILIGQVLDTNSSLISRALGAAGVRTVRMVSAGDDRAEIIGSLSEELRRSDIVVATGGLGPTKDDVTKAALAELSDSTEYVEHKGQAEIISMVLGARGIDLLDVNLAQALVPDKCEVIKNRFGTAPIMVFRFPEGGKFGHGCVLYSLPGVPYEAEEALEDVVNDIKSHFRLSSIYHKSIMTFGIAESMLARMIEPWESALPEDMRLAYLPDATKGVCLRLSVYGGDAKLQEKRVSERIEALRGILGEAIYSWKEDTLQNRIGEMLREAGMTVSVAESCTGGLISSLLTSVAGSSEYYLGSVTSYANSVKTGVLGVPEEIIREFGAVSSECVSKMAEGVRRITGSDFSVATSGIAGPGGGSDEKPVGTVWIGICSPAGTSTFRIFMHGDRRRNIERFASNALNLLRLEIEKVTGCLSRV